MPKIFIDAEFIEDGRTIELISLGMVSEGGREFYAECLDTDLSKASPWVQQNVIKNLWSKAQDKTKFNKWIRDGGYGGLLSKAAIRAQAIAFCGEDPEFWGEWCSYDWVVLCQLFGTMMDLPKGWPMRCRDVVQYCEDHLHLSTEDWPASLETEGNHNALLGADTVLSRYEWCAARDN